MTLGEHAHHLHHLAGLDRDLSVRRSTAAAGAAANRSYGAGRSSGEHRLSVRSLICSIESATKHAKGER